jgi:hypothetical protein
MIKVKYYNDVRSANKKVDDICEQIIKHGGEVNLNIIVLNLTNLYAVGEKMVEKRFIRWVESYSDIIYLEDGFIRKYEEKSRS